MVIHTAILVDFTVNMCQVELIYTEIKVYTVEPASKMKVFTQAVQHMWLHFLTSLLLYIGKKATRNVQYSVELVLAETRR